MVAVVCHAFHLLQRWFLQGLHSHCHSQRLQARPVCELSPHRCLSLYCPLHPLQAKDWQPVAAQVCCLAPTHSDRHRQWNGRHGCSWQAAKVAAAPLSPQATPGPCLWSQLHATLGDSLKQGLRQRHDRRWLQLPDCICKGTRNLRRQPAACHRVPGPSSFPSLNQARRQQPQQQQRKKHPGSGRCCGFDLPRKWVLLLMAFAKTRYMLDASVATQTSPLL